MSEPIRDVETAVRELGALPVPTGAAPGLTPEQHAKITELIGDVKPASDGLLVSFAESVRDRREHAHPKWEDLYCLNLSSYMGERMAYVLRRLMDAEAQVAELLKERHSTNEALDDAVHALRANQQRIAEWETRLGEYERPADEDPIAYTLTGKAEADDVRPQVRKLKALLAGQRAAVEADGITRRIAPTQALHEDTPAALRAEDAADILTLAPALSVDATYNETFRTIELELTATQRQWSEWLHALDVDMSRTTHRGGCVTSHATWRGVHVVIRCWWARPETGGEDR